MVQMENGSSDDHGADRPLSYADLVRWFVIVALVVLGVAVAIAIKETLLLFAIAFLIAMVLNPAVTLLERRGLRRGLAVGLLIIVLLATLALVVFLVVPPFFEQLQLLVGMAVKHITHYYQLAGLKVLQLAYQPLQVFPVYRLGHGNTRFPEMPGLTKMEVRHQQGFFLFPENHPLRR